MEFHTCKIYKSLSHNYEIQSHNNKIEKPFFCYKRVCCIQRCWFSLQFQIAWGTLYPVILTCKSVLLLYRNAFLQHIQTWQISHLGINRQNITPPVLKNNTSLRLTCFNSNTIWHNTHYQARGGLITSDLYEWIWNTVRCWKTEL